MKDMPDMHHDGGQRTARGQGVPWIWIAPIPVALVIGLLIGLQLPSPGDAAQAPAGTSQGPTEPAGEKDPTDVARLEPGDETAVGSVDAPVVMVAYTDFQCPYCAKWTDGTLPQLMDKYVDSGQLRIEWRDLDVFGQTSLVAARAGQAAAMQGGYQAFHARMAKGGSIASASAYGDANLKSTAEDLGLDGDRFLSDMDSRQAKDAVERNINEARSLGVASTPVFLINQSPFVGAQPTENFVQAIDAELQKTTEGAG
ncbi:DsbA family protein [Arthrobacter sp.]